MGIPGSTESTDAEPHRAPIAGEGGHGFSTEILKVGDRTHVVVRGDLDLTTCKELERTLSGVDAYRSTVVVDLREVVFLDSTGLRTLWLIRQKIASIGGKALLGSPSPAVMRVLAMTKLDKIFDVIEIGTPRDHT